MILSEDDKSKFEPLISEVYELLLISWAYNRKMVNLGSRLKAETRYYFVEEVTALKSMSNDIILGLCKLDDETSDFSLRALRKYLLKANKIKNQIFIRNMNDSINTFRSEINSLKTKHRNAYIAHLSGATRPDILQYPDFSNYFKIPIRTALTIVDEVWGERYQFGLKPGSWERTVMFRDELEL